MEHYFASYVSVILILYYVGFNFAYTSQSLTVFCPLFGVPCLCVCVVFAGLFCERFMIELIWIY